MNRLTIVSGLLLGISLVTTASGQAPPASTSSLSTSLGVVVFPAKGQTPQVQSQDEGECYAWSKGQTGIDPMAPAAATAPAQAAAQPAEQPKGQRVKGAARGAAGGAVIGAVAGDTGKGAAIGATAGVLKGGSDARKQQAAAEQQAAQQQQQAEQQQQAAAQQQKEQFNKGFAACLEAKGYTVK